MLACVFLLLRRRGCLALSVYGGREEKAQCQNISNQITIMSSAISEGKKNKLILPAGGQNSMLSRKMQAKLLLPLRKVSPAAALWYQTSSTCQMRNAVWC